MAFSSRVSEIFRSLLEAMTSRFCRARSAATRSFVVMPDASTTVFLRTTPCASTSIPDCAGLLAAVVGFVVWADVVDGHCAIATVTTKQKRVRKPTACQRMTSLSFARNSPFDAIVTSARKPTRSMRKSGKLNRHSL